MIYFQTLYFMCDQVTRWKIEDHLGMERHMTVNGEWPVVMGDKGVTTRDRAKRLYSNT